MTRSLKLEPSRVIVSEVEWTREGGDRFNVMLERIMNEDDVELINSTELTISHPNTLIFEDSTRKKGSLLPPYNSRRVNEVVEFLISLEALDTRILHCMCSTKHKNISIICFSITPLDSFYNEIKYPY